MFGKLLKYECQAAGRMLWPVWGGVLLLGILVNLSTRLVAKIPNTTMTIVHTLLILLFVVGLIGACIMAVAVMVMRFYRSMLSREGYLTHTLPVGIHSLIWSRMLIAVAYFAVTALVVCLSIYLCLFRVNLADVFWAEIWHVLQCAIAEYGGNVIGWIAEFFLFLLSVGLSVCLMFYAALSIGYSFSKQKMLLSIVFYFVLQFMTQIVGTIAIVGLANGKIGHSLFWAIENVYTGVHVVMLLLILSAVIFSAIYYVITVQLLRRKLNLE